MRIAGLFLLIAMPAGCARYEYEIVRPGEFAGHIGKDDVLVERDPLSYRFNAVNNYLVVRIYNNTEAQMQLAGAQSSAVDPGGQSHPLRAQPLPPHSFIKLILPPIPPQIYPVGPSITIGASASSGGYSGGCAGAWSERQYVAVVDDDAVYWDWKDEGAVRLTLMFAKDGSTFTQEFAFQRVKM
ncbi:MAG: hypothetical protein ACREJC_13710 [Tepidisphaeraceae bacterium]